MGFVLKWKDVAERKIQRLHLTNNKNLIRYLKYLNDEIYVDYELGFFNTPPPYFMYWIITLLPNFPPVYRKAIKKYGLENLKNYFNNEEVIKLALTMKKL